MTGSPARCSRDAMTISLSKSFDALASAPAEMEEGHE